MNPQIKRMPRNPMMDFFGNIPKDTVNLAIGEPLFKTPERIVIEEKKSLDFDANRYTPVKGLLELRKKLVEKLKQENNISANTDNIIVTCGSSEAIGLTIQTIVSENDNAIVIDPHFPIVYPQIEYMGAEVRRISLKEENKYLPDIDAIRRSIDENTKLIYMNSPHNPTGSVFPRKIIKQIIDLAAEDGIYLLSDEVYEKIIYEDKHYSPAGISNYEKIITVNSFSKSYSMCGHRVGYATANNELISNLEKLKFSHSVSTPHSSQKAAISALNSNIETKEMVKKYAARREIVRGKLDEAGAEYVLPRGAFYYFLNVEKIGGGQKVYNDMLKEKIVVLPGKVFGKEYENYVRISFVSDEKTILDAMKKFQKLF